MSELEPTPPTEAATAQPERSAELIETYGDYMVALDRALALVQREVRIFEKDLSESGFNGVARFEQLKTFLMKSRANRIDILVRDTDYLARSCPRMQMLLRQFGHAINIHRTLPETQGINDAFMLVDQRHLVRRFHTDYARGELVLNDPHEAGNLRERFDELWAASEPGLSATTLGL